ncbi:MAG: apolipoprotein N-acyltransferase [Firmicutes bacterium HGW-Firmicutes-21]|nr:MAG: apolipoprotein N-acyltransferase [Firmicutes bacterium HGW-Firmicutes-21]
MSRVINNLKGLRLSPFILCFVAGIVYALPYYFNRLFFLSFLSLTAFFVILLTNDRRKKIFRYFYVFSLGFYFTLYLWLSKLYPFAGFDFTPFQGTVIIIFACIGIPLYHALVHSLIMSVTRLLPNKDTYIIAGFGAAWILSEWLMSLGPLSFPWGRIALSQVGSLVSVQTVSLFGSYFLVIIVVCASMLFSLAVIKKSRFLAAVGCILIAVNLLTGTILYYLPIKQGEAVKVAVLQGNAASGDKWESGNLQRIWNTYLNMADEAAMNGAELIVLPESAIPVRFYQGGELYDSLAEITDKYNITILAGVIVSDSKGSYNSVIAVYPDGSLSARYDKQHLVPFGEYIPYRPFLEAVFPFINGLNLSGMNTVPGEDSAIIEIKGIKNGSLVCFDSIFDSLSRRSVRDGAELLTVVTNDSWFKDSAGIKQHLGHSVLRAIESRRYIIRAANTGISAFITPKGDAIEATQALTEAVIYYDAAPIESKTLYFYIGNAVLYIAVAFQIFIFGLYFYNKKGSKRE